ncbi:hypothetical protein [Vampirovibrio sp.]|uniref:hypothetical protein n=1 Tax=Vampirovibrio sp. TaxID=2717857 RepID=UPI0035938FF3
MPKGINTKNIKNLLTWLGKDEDAFLPIALMCVANGTLKPLITLSNPKEKPDRKIYAAKREFLNEMVALPVCFAFAKGFGAAGVALIKPALKGLAPEVAQQKLNLLKTTVFSAMGVISANFAVPSLANALFHPLDRWSAPLLKKFQKNMQPLSTPPTANSDEAKPLPVQPHISVQPNAAFQPAFGQRIPPLLANGAYSSHSLARFNPLSGYGGLPR